MRQLFDNTIVRWVSPVGRAASAISAIGPLRPRKCRNVTALRVLKCGIREFYNERFHELHIAARGLKSSNFGGHRLHFNFP
jgi:hypothetical protein